MPCAQRGSPGCGRHDRRWCLARAPLVRERGLAPCVIEFDEAVDDLLAARVRGAVTGGVEIDRPRALQFLFRLAVLAGADQHGGKAAVHAGAIRVVAERGLGIVGDEARMALGGFEVAGVAQHQ